MDKNQAIIDYLNTCPSIVNNPLFFNFANAKDENKQITVRSSDKNRNRSYVDGSVEKQFSFTIYDFRSISYNAIVTQTGLVNENVDELKDIQGIIDWRSARFRRHGKNSAKKMTATPNTPAARSSAFKGRVK